MPYLLDTNVALRLRDGDPSTMAHVAALDGATLISIVTRVELEGGVVRQPGRASVRRLRLDVMLDSLAVIAFDDACADAYRSIAEVAGYSRRKILDRMIAAQALVHRATLVTSDPEDFRDVPGLSLLIW